MPTRGLRAALLATLIAVVWYQPAHSQAWLPERGEGSVSLSYVFFTGGDHLFSSDRIDGESTRGYVAEGNRWFLGDTRAHTVYASFEMGVLERVAASASVAHVTSQYEGRSGDYITDDGQYRGTLQDARLELRGRALSSPLIVTPFVGYSFPTHDYETRGHSAPGGGVAQFQLGVNLGRQLSPFLPAAYVHARYSHGFAEEVAGYDLRPGNLDFELGYVVGTHLVLRGLATRRWTGGGLDWISDEEGGDGSHSGPLAVLHNQITNEEFTRVGGGVALSVFPRVDFFAAILTTVAGKNTDDANIASAGTSWSFGAQ